VVAAEAFPQYARGAAMAAVAAAHFSYVLDVSTAFKTVLARAGGAATFAGFAAVGARALGWWRRRGTGRRWCTRRGGAGSQYQNPS
jgi:hypothetical protein